jgi:hypothetical protein
MTTDELKAKIDPQQSARCRLLETIDYLLEKADSWEANFEAEIPPSMSMRSPEEPVSVDCHTITIKLRGPLRDCPCPQCVERRRRSLP